MNVSSARRILGGIVGAGLALRPETLRACAACFGKSDSSLAAGLNWGILSLLGIVMLVLAGIAAFFVQVARRSAREESSGDAPGSSEATP